MTIKHYLDLLFNEDEGIAVAAEYRHPLVIPKSDYIPNERHVWVAANPIKPYTKRESANCTAYRNIIIEFDDLPLDQQLDFVKNKQLPVSAIVFSGNKSCHFVIALTQDIGPEEYRKWFLWITNILEGRNDRALQGPASFTRIGGAIRDDEKTKGSIRQQIIYLGERINPVFLAAYLDHHKDKEPKKEKKTRKAEAYGYKSLNPLTKRFIETGESNPHIARHEQLKLSAIDIYEAGFTPEEAMDLLKKKYLQVNTDKDPIEVERMVDWVWGNL